MDKARSSLVILDYGVFPKASDHEETAEIGWLLYSTRVQDEERIRNMLSLLVRENIGGKWRPSRTNDRYRKDPGKTTPRTFALHLEGSSKRAGNIRQKRSRWYGLKATVFPVGMKMRLVQPIQYIISFNCKAKYSSFVARQAALSSRLCTSSTWELTANLVLDNKEPSSGLTLQQVLTIPSQILGSKPMFHSIDHTWRSTNGITLSFLPENESDARSYIAGLIPYLKESQNH